MRKIYTLCFSLLALMVMIGMLTSQSLAQTVNVKIRCNTSTCLDTLRTTHLVRVMGESKKGLTPAISWSSGPTLTNVGGDYWEATVQAQLGDTLSYKFVANFDLTNPTIHWSGWEGPLDAGGSFSSGNDRILIVGSVDTTLPVQFYNGTDNKLAQYWKPFAMKQDTVAVYFRINMAGEIGFDPVTHVPGVWGGKPLGTDAWPKIIDLVRETSSRNGAFWSGVAYIPKANVTTADWQNYKFVYNGVWESSSNRFFPFTNNTINVTGDTTIQWVYFSNKAPSAAPAATVNVKFRCNTSTALDTLQPTHIVGLGGESQKGIVGLNWNASLKLTNVGGDYWETTVAAQPGDTMYYSFVTKYNDTTFSKVNWGWDGPINNGVNSKTNRMLVVGNKDTTLPLQYYNGWTTKVDQYAAPYAKKQDTIAVYFRVNMGGVIFNPASQTVEVQGGIGSASWTKIVSLVREVNSINGGTFWSGAAHIAKASVAPGNQQKYKFVFRSPETWESSSDRSFFFSNNVINVVGDTTIHWNYFNNKAPSGSVVTSNVLFRLKLGALEKAGLFNRAVGDRVGVTGSKGWVVPPFDFDTDPLMLKMTYNSDLEEWNLIEPFTLYPNDEIVYKYYVAWDSSRVNASSVNYIPGLNLGNDGWEEPGVTGGADRKYVYTDAIEQILPGDFGADQQFFNSIHPNGAISTPITVTFGVNMTPATDVATNPTNPLFRPGTDSVFISFDGCFVPLTQGKTMYGTDNRVELKDLDGDGIYTGSIALTPPTLYQLCYRVTYSSYPNANITNGGGIRMGRRYYQYISPTRVQAGGVITWPSTCTLATMAWKADNLTNENPPDLVTPVGVKTGNLNLPIVYALEQNYPNPFNPTTMITYSVPEKTHVTIGVYNILGQRITSLFDQEQVPGTHSIMWNTQNNHNQALSSGVYFVKMEAGSFAQIKKMLLMK